MPYYINILRAAGSYYGFDLDPEKPLRQASRPARDLLLYGYDSPVFKFHFPHTTPPRTVAMGRFEGVVPNLLRRHAESMPPTLVRALERWEEQGSAARLESLEVLRFSSPEVLQALRQSRASRFLGEPLGPAAIAIRPGSAEKVLAALAELGYLGEIKKA